MNQETEKNNEQNYYQVKCDDSLFNALKTEKYIGLVENTRPYGRRGFSAGQGIIFIASDRSTTLKAIIKAEYGFVYQEGIAIQRVGVVFED